MSGFLRFSRKVGMTVAMAGTAALLASCQMAKNQLTFDRSANRDRQDYRDVLGPMPPSKEDAAPVPDFKPVLSTPQELRLPRPLVTVSVNQTVSLRDLMFELAEQADVDIELDPQIHGSIIFTAKQRPFDEVVNRICEMAGLRYNFKDKVLRIELDRPYNKTYAVDYLNIDRTGDSSVTTSISASSTGGTGGGSSSKVQSTFKPDLWKELDDNLKQILTSSDTYISLATLSDPVAVPVNPAPPPPMPVQDPNAPIQSAPPPLPGSPQVSAMPAAATPVINVTPASAPALPSAPAAYSISRQTGTLNVFASERQQLLVRKYLENFRKMVTTQVLIEAKVLEVDLTDEYASGIDWTKLNLLSMAHNRIKFPMPALVPPDTADMVSGVLGNDSDFSLAVKAISRFGTVRALSSPRVTVLNNQPAVVNVAQNVMYLTFKVTPGTQSTSSSTPTTIDPTLSSVPDGVLLNVLPKADPDTGEILLSVRPTVSKITSFLSDPTPILAVSLAGQPIPAGLGNNQIPMVAVQEMDSLVRMQSGQIMVMGGLMKDINSITDVGVPVAGDIPFIGNLFKNHSDRVQKSELVILLRAQLITGSNVDNEDRRVYDTFGLDRHPAKL
jgi:MSHA biogenesis protein MshL